MKKVEEKETKVLKIDDHIDTEQDLKNDKQISETAANASPQEIMEAYLKDPVVKQNLINTALDFITIFRGNWFTLEQIRKKTHFKDQDSSIQVIQMMIFSDLCVSKVENNEQKFKIVISKEEKIKELERQVEQLDLKKNMLLLEIDRIKDKK